jgi:translation initiation factor 2 alpha subunit (eIF-2alpha)|tara:strand:+ start:140 stop:514 length:375 start_codon:yes stop_codon:yes gene_type:complete
MIKLKEIIKESKFAFDRKFGEPLPTFKGVMEKHQTLIEKRELGGALINKIEQLTDRNNHTEARLTLAKAVGDKKLVQAYEGIDTVHTYLRDMNDLSKARDRLDRKLFAQAKKTFSDYSIIMGAF